MLLAWALEPPLLAAGLLLAWALELLLGAGLFLALGLDFLLEAGPGPSRLPALSRLRARLNNNKIIPKPDTRNLPRYYVKGSEFRPMQQDF